MNTLKQNDININFTKPEEYREKLDTLNNQITPILDDFIKYYLFYNKNPDYAEYQQMFENIKNNLNTINSELFILTNNVEGNLQDLNKRFLKLNELILIAKNKNHQLKQQLGIVEQKNNSATEMISNYNQLYDMSYAKNWGIFLSIILSCSALYIVFKKETLQTNS